MSVIASKGGVPITDEEALKAHLASLLRLENVGVMLGAGASCCAGGRVMNELWQDFLKNFKESAEWLVQNQFLSKDAVVAGGTTPNVEQLADALEIAASDWKRKGEEQSLLDALEKAKNDLLRNLVSAALLNPAWWEKPAGSEVDDKKLAVHRELLQKLTAARQPGQPSPWLFTTNYDLALEWAAESIDLQVINGFLGLHSRRFSPQSFDLGFRNTQARGEARFGVYHVYLVKIHGSLTWIEQEEQPYEVPATLAWSSIKTFIDGKSEMPDGLMVLPRAAKYLQTVGFTLGELVRRFSDFLARPQTCLIVSGYGFGDGHLNRLLRSALLNPTLQLMIFLPEYDGNDESGKLNPFVRKLLSLKSPRVVIVGGGNAAFFDRMVSYIPDPVVFDEDAREFLKSFKETTAALATATGK